MAQPIYEMGALAAELLIGKIKGDNNENQVHELEVKLIPRKSSAKRSS